MIENGIPQVTSADIGNKLYVIAANVLEEIKAALRLPEMGGILGVRDNRTVTEFYHDNTGKTTARNYTPDIDSLNMVLRDWKRCGIEFVGFVHSHPPNKKTLSNIDIKFAKKIKTHCGMNEILMLIYLPADESFHQYVLRNA